MGRTRVHGRVVTPGGVVDDGEVLVARGRVEYAGPRADAPDEPAEVVVAPEQGYVLPGLVDVHNHGGNGASFASGRASDVATAVQEHLRHGTTSVVAGLVTDAPERMLAAAAAAADAVERGELAGILLEGPFLSVDRCGAQDRRHLSAPDVGLAAELLDAGRGHVKAMTLAPELDGAAAVTDVLLGRGVLPAVGHTEADPGLVRRTLAATRAALGRPGVVTHLFNGMPPLHHRDPGPAAGALGAAARGDAVVELVADGVHLDDATVVALFDLLGPDRILLVTDAMAGAGMPDGVYGLGSQEVWVSRGVARLGERGPLAGGTAHLLDVVRRCVRAGVGLPAAVAAASSSPAAALGLGPSGLTAGARGDVLVTDADLRPVRVLRGGSWS